MLKSNKPFSAIAAGIAALAVVTVALRAQEVAPWEQLLRAQLEEAHKCVLSGTLFVREQPVDGGIAYSGRAKCFDGRDFDFSQSKPHMKFEIKACEPAVC